MLTESFPVPLYQCHHGDVKTSCVVMVNIYTFNTVAFVHIAGLEPFEEVIYDNLWKFLQLASNC